MIHSKKILNNVEIFHGNLSFNEELDKEKLKDKFNFLLTYSTELSGAHLTNDGNLDNSPGLQLLLHPSIKEIRIIEDYILDCLKNYKAVSTDDFFSVRWIYINKNKHTKKMFHTHKDLLNGTHKYKTTFTYVYYVQMPDNLKGDDGYINFKDKDTKEIYSFLPKEGDLLIFPSTILHAPNTNENSKNDRVVLAGNLHFIDYSSLKYKKTIV